MADLGQKGIEGYIHYGPANAEVFFSENDILQIGEGYNKPAPSFKELKEFDRKATRKIIIYKKAWFQNGPNGLRWYEWFLTDSPIFNK